MSINIGNPTRWITYNFVDDFGSPIPYVEIMIVRFEDKIPYGYEEYERYYGKSDDIGKITMGLDDKNYRIYARKEGYNIYPDYTLVGIEYWYAGSYVKNVMLYKIATTLEETKKLEEQAKKREEELKKIIEEETKPVESFGRVTFRVYDAYTKQPIAKARVEVDGYSAVTDSSGLAYIYLTYKEYNVKVTANGYESYSDKLYCRGEIGIALIPITVHAIPKPTLTVDKDSIVEGESITLSVDPNNITVDLYELVDNQYNFIKSFTAQTTLTPTRGDHTFAVKYVYRYGSYSSEVWSNVIYVHVAPKLLPPVTPLPITPIPTPTLTPTPIPIPTPTPTPTPTPIIPTKIEDRLGLALLFGLILFEEGRRR